MATVMEPAEAPLGAVRSAKSLDQVADRVADSQPGLMAAAGALALEAQRQATADYQRRQRDAHQLWKNLRGLQDSAPDEPDDMGRDIIIAGDNAMIGATVTPATPAPKPTPAPSNGLSKTALAGMLTAATLAGGGVTALGSYLASRPNTSNTTINQPATPDSDYDLRIYRPPGTQ